LLVHASRNEKGQGKATNFTLALALTREEVHEGGKR